MTNRPPSPTLSEMEFDAPHFTSDLADATKTRPAEVTINLDGRNLTRGLGQVQATSQGAVLKKAKSRMTRYLPPDGRDAFIGPLLPTANDTIKLIRTHCPSLRDTPPGDIALQLRFDDTAPAVKNVLFRVLNDAWPEAVIDVLPLVHVSVTSQNSNCQQGRRQSLLSANATAGAGQQKKTWEDLKREGALLGVQGSTDREAEFGPYPGF